jgi:hypothetical protein
VTIELRDVKKEDIELKNDSLKVTTTSDKKSYEGTINFFEEVETEVILFII